MEKKNLLSGKEKKSICVLDFIKTSKIPNLQLFMEKKMKFLRMHKFSVTPEIFQ